MARFEGSDTPVVSVTPLAVAKFREFLKNSPNAHVRLALIEGGCSGFLYDLQIVHSPIAPTSRVDRSNGFAIVVSPEHVIYLEDSTIDWEIQPDGNAGFKFHNPNALEPTDTE
ncbi:HesB/IscA family protein [Neorhodopirellula lusitana]|nr:iron-sulfur cluster assembly accessory protein [Neorhodopirellula lusitana]